jgi:hypothetical protein
MGTGLPKGDNATPDKVRQRPNGVPSDWTEQEGKKPGNTKWVNPNNEHDYVRVKPDGIVTQVRNGQAHDCAGNPVSLRSPEAHGICSGEFVFRP